MTTSEDRLQAAVEAWTRAHPDCINRINRWKARRQAEGFETLPIKIVDDLVGIAAYVSAGRSYIGVEPYPDAQARFVLGALHESRERQICEIPHATLEEEEECERMRLGEYGVGAGE